MIIHIPFIHSLRLRSLLLLPPHPTDSSRPTRIRLYTNLPHPPSFSDIEAMKPTQELDIAQSPSSWQAIQPTGPGGGERDQGGRREVEDWPLKVQKMASVWSVTLMISDSEGGEKSRLYYLGFKVSERFVFGGFQSVSAMDGSYFGSLLIHPTPTSTSTSNNPPPSRANQEHQRSQRSIKEKFRPPMLPTHPCNLWPRKRVQVTPQFVDEQQCMVCCSCQGLPLPVSLDCIMLYGYVS